jgi:CRP-like cAMP-binding protein
LGVGSVVLGLVLQDVLGGLFSGLALISSSPFAVGDWIKIDEVEGKVKDMDWRSVTLETRNRDLVVIPNALISKEKFYNFSRPTALHMERVGFDISFDDRPNKVKDVLLEAVKATPDILDIPAPGVALVSYDEFSIHYEVQYFIEHYDQQPKIRNDFVSRVWYLNRRHGVTFPTRAHEVYQFEGTQVAADNTITAEQLAEQIQALQVLDLPATEIRKLAEHAELKEYAMGESILRQGQLAEYFYILMEGDAVEEVAAAQQQSAKVSHRLRRGDFFGVTGMVRREPSPVSIVAEQDVTVMIIELEAMHQMLLNHPQMAQDMAFIMERREDAVRLVRNGRR